MNQQTYLSGILFSQAHKLVRERIADILKPYGLTPTHWSVLGIVISAPEGVRLATVSKTLTVKAPLVTNLSTELIEIGLINRISHHTDGRAKLLVATTKGKHIASEIEQKIKVEVDQLLQGLTATELKTFNKVLATIIDNAGQTEDLL
jgi:DNA-binding MarR family transcriptional regulator